MPSLNCYPINSNYIKWVNVFEFYSNTNNSPIDIENLWKVAKEKKIKEVFGDGKRKKNLAESVLIFVF